MKLIYGTKNQAKLEHMRQILKDENIEISGLDHDLPVVEEVGTTVLENARIKALHYYKHLKRPVFSCDSALYFEDLPAEEQAGIYVRRVQGKKLSDEEMVTFYSDLAKKHGGQIIARYQNAICLVMGEEEVYTYDGRDIGSESFKIVETPHPKRVEGFPIDCLSVDIKHGTYYYDMDDYMLSDDQMTLGFQKFFKGVLK